MSSQAGGQGQPRPDTAADDARTAATADAFTAAFRHHPSGVAVITADPGDGPVALTVSSLISVSMAPPTVAFSLSDASSSAQAVARSKTVVVHFVRRADMQLARLCATSGKDRFGPDVRWERLASGEPYYPQVDLWFVAAIRGQLAVPGARLVTAELLWASNAVQEARPDDALVYANRGWHGLHALGDQASNKPLLLWPVDSATF